jgi:tryptophanase
MYKQVTIKMNYQLLQYITQQTAGSQPISAVNMRKFCKFCKVYRYKIVGSSTDHILNYTYFLKSIFYIISFHWQHGSV